MSKQTTTVTLNDIEDCILNRHIAKLKGFFNEDMQKQNVDKMFYKMDKNEMQQVSDEKIVYQDDEYICVRSTRAYARHGWYHMVLVFGVDELPWVHRLLHDMNFEDNTYVWTREQILRKMRFDKSIKSDSESFTWKNRETVRIQGDLSIMKLQSLDEHLDNVRTSQARDAEWDFHRKFNEEISKEHENDVQHFDGVMNEVRGITRDIITHPEGYEGGALDQIRLKEIRVQYNLRRVRYDFMESQLRWMKDMELRRIVDVEARSQGIEKKQKDAKAKAERMFDTGYLPGLRAKQKQMNLRAGNHLIVIEKVYAFDPDKWGGINDDILVVEEGGTLCYTIHDEHQNKQIILAPGRYEFTLLERHQQDRR